jgi:hypothetical protein
VRNESHDEAIVEAYGPEERAVGWYHYLESKLTFPYMACCAISRTVSPLKKGELVEVRRMAPEDACSSDMLVRMRWQSRNLAVPSSQLIAVDPNEAAAEATAVGITG